MRTFTRGPASDRRFVLIELNGSRIGITEGKSDGTINRKEKDLPSESVAQRAIQKMADELIARGYVEQSATGGAKAKPRASVPAREVVSPAAEALLVSNVFEDEEEQASSTPALPRLAAVPASGPGAEGAPKKKKKRSKKKRKGAENSDGLDKRVLAGVGLAGALFVAVIGYIIYDSFLKPASIVGTWQGSKLEYEVSQFLTHSSYRLVLDEQHNATMTLEEKFTQTGTYSTTGDRLKLVLKDEEGSTSTIEYKISLARATLDLFDVDSGKKVVQLIRQEVQPSGASPGPPPPETPTGVAAGPDGKFDETADARLASIKFSPKDSAFSIRHPDGWKVETGSRPDNNYSWARFTKGSAKIQVFADVAGSLMSGSDLGGEHEEGSHAAPVHNAHELYKKTASEGLENYQESEPSVFKGSQLGEGRIAAWTASGGLFGSKSRGYRVTLLTNNRRITVMCQCSERDFEQMKPTFLAVCRSVSH